MTAGEQLDREQVENGALQDAVLNRARFWSFATRGRGVTEALTRRILSPCAGIDGLLGPAPPRAATGASGRRG